MQVTKELLEKIAKLSRLEIADENKEKMRNELEKMIGFVEKLNELNTDNIEPMQVMSNHIHPLRDDEIKHQLSIEDVHKNSPLTNKNYFAVPKVIKQP